MRIKALWLLPLFFLTPSAYSTCVDLSGQTHCDETLTVGAKLGVGSISPAAQIDNRILSSGTTGQLTQATTGQSADMEQWVDSNTVVQSGVDKTAKFYGDGSHLTNLTLTSGSTSYIQNSSTLQSGATSYPAFSYAGSSISAPIAAFINIAGASTTFSNAGSTVVFQCPVGLSNNVGTTYDYFNSQSSGTRGKWSHAGLILQSTQAIIAISSSTSGNAFTATRSSWTITPLFSTSRVRIHATFEFTNVNSNTSTCYYALMRNGTNVMGGTTAYGHTQGTTTTQYSTMGTIDYEDSPASTSALTYEIYTKSDGGTACVVNNGARSATLFWLEEAGQ